MSGMWIRNLAALNHAQGFTLWHYSGGGESLATISAEGFFNPARDMMRVGDMVMVAASDGGRVLVVAATGEAVRTEALR